MYFSAKLQKKRYKSKRPTKKSKKISAGLFQLDDITPPCGGILAAKVMLDGVGKHLGFALGVALGVLLSTQNDGLRAVKPVDAVYHRIQRFQLLEPLGVDVKQVELYGRVGDDDSSLSSDRMFREIVSSIHVTDEFRRKWKV